MKEEITRIPTYSENDVLCIYYARGVSNGQYQIVANPRKFDVFSILCLKFIIHYQNMKGRITLERQQ